MSNKTENSHKNSQLIENYLVGSPGISKDVGKQKIAEQLGIVSSDIVTNNS